MSRSSQRALVFAVLLATLLATTGAFAVQITFQVRMSEQILQGNFDPGSDFVDIAGTFNDWGTNQLTPLADADGDSIYEVVIGGFSVGQDIEYKYRINAQWDGTEEFPGVGFNRLYTVQDGDNLVIVWYNDIGPGDGGGEVEIGPTHWWNDTVFYEIFVRSFQDSDGDGIGDFPGLTAKLDYLNDGDPATDTDLGITGIWLMPINDSPSYHGYDAVDYESINPDYGTMADFEAFLAAAHARGIKVIIDYVMNHCSSQHPWFEASEDGDLTYRDYFRWSPNDPGQDGPWGQQVWHWNNNNWFYGLFWSGMPDLNYETPEVKTAMFNSATFWLDTVGVDGFRLDAVLYIHEVGDQLQDTPETLQFWQDFNLHVKSVKPEAFSVGEAWTGSNTVVQYVIDDRLDFCFEFELSYAMVGAANGGDADWLRTKADQVYNLYPYLQYAPFLTNHDQDRSFTVFGEDQAKAKVAAGIYLAMPGVPFIYYGEEIGMIGSGAHENIRTPMQWTAGSSAGFTTGLPWQAINPNYPQFNVAVEESDSGSLLNWYKQLVRVRNQTPVLRRGTYASLNSTASPVMAFVRADSMETVLCLANTSVDDQIGFTLTAASGDLVPGDYSLTNLLEPFDSLEITVTPDLEIEGLEMDGQSVAYYRFTGASAVDPVPGDLPKTGLMLEQNHPNPFNPSTTIRYSLPERSHVRIGVYDLAGREVMVLADEHQEEGPQEVRWEGVDQRGQAMGAGTYFLRLDAGNQTRMTKMMLIK